MVLTNVQNIHYYQLTRLVSCKVNTQSRHEKSVKAVKTSLQLVSYEVKQCSCCCNLLLT